MSGTLFAVATPIGNLEDVTLRALRVLREADLIAAEDTRRTARLLAHHGVATPSLSFHAHNARTRIPQILSRLQAGARVALVTDAGTPGVSDPGTELVEACVQAGISVEPVPGVSAPLAAAAASGFPLIPMTIFGFPPRRSKDRSAWFTRVFSLHHTVTFFESPLRTAATLAEIGPMLVDRPIMLAREVTKKHQEFLRGTVSEVLAKFHQHRGEVTIVVGPPWVKELAATIAQDAPEIATAVAEFTHMPNRPGFTRRAAIVEVARRHNIPASVLYGAVERAKDSGQ